MARKEISEAALLFQVPLRHGIDLLRAAKARHAREEVGRPVTCACGGLKGMLMRSVLSPVPFTVVR